MKEGSILYKYRSVFFYILITLIMLLGWVVYMNIMQHNKTHVSLTVAPSDSDVYINGHLSNPDSTILLPRGEYTITVNKSGFLEQSVYVPVDDTLDPIDITVLLTAVSEEAKEWVDKNIDPYLIHGEYYNSEIENNDPILPYIPHQNPLFTLVRVGNSTDPIMIDTRSLGQYKNGPVEYIKRQGIDPGNYGYIFNYESPF